MVTHQEGSWKLATSFCKGNGQMAQNSLQLNTAGQLELIQTELQNMFFFSFFRYGLHDYHVVQLVEE